MEKILSTIKIGDFNQLKTNQNFKALFGEKGFKALQQIFDLCCSLFKREVHCVTVDGVRTRVCDLSYPLELDGVTVNNLTELLAAVEDEYAGSIAQTDGCNVVLLHTIDVDLVIGENDCIPLDTP